MTAQHREEPGDLLGLALLRAALVVVIVLSEQLVDARQLGGSGFFVILAVAAAYSLAGVAVALRWPSGRAGRLLTRAHPTFDVLLLAGLCYTSGGAYSDVRKAFFVIPLAAAFSERPRSTASWSLLAVAVFSLVAVLAAGHPAGAVNTWQRLTLNQDLYLAWTGAAATLLALALRRRSAHTEELANSRQRLVTHAIESVERERTRLAGALHDSPVQNLMAARHDLRRAERTGDRECFVHLHEAIDATITELREEIFRLHPHVLDHVGLSAAFEQVARHHMRQANFEITVAILDEVEPARRQVVFALGRELLANAAQHARAQEISLRLEREGSSLALEVKDDGCGIPEGRIRQALLDGHVGLAAVTERVAVLGGRVAIASSPNRGTSVRVSLPSCDERAAARRDVSDLVTRFDTPLVSTP
jgi:two-component system NarL family sensor kinase